MEITEKEFAIINEIHKNNLPDQRAIASSTGISLGMTNLIVKRLIKQGYIKAKQLNRRKIHYLLTRQGFAEKVKKSYGFTVRTFQHFYEMKTKIDSLLSKHVTKGEVNFTLTGSGEMMEIMTMIVKDISQSKPIIITTVQEHNDFPVITVNTGTGVTYNLLDYLMGENH